MTIRAERYPIIGILPITTITCGYNIMQNNCSRKSASYTWPMSHIIHSKDFSWITSSGIWFILPTICFMTSNIITFVSTFFTTVYGRSTRNCSDKFKALPTNWAYQFLGQKFSKYVSSTHNMIIQYIIIKIKFFLINSRKSLYRVSVCVLKRVLHIQRELHTKSYTKLQSQSKANKQQHTHIQPIWRIS